MLEQRNRLKQKNSAYFILGALLVGTVAVGAATQARVGTPERPRVHFTGKLDREAVMKDGDGLVRVELVMGADQRSVLGSLTSPVRMPTDLVIVLDKSGSMSGAKITHAHAAIRELIGKLSNRDRLALITFSHDAQVRIPLERATDQRRSAWLNTVYGIGAGGGTRMLPALQMAMDMVEYRRGMSRVPRVIVLSDGLTEGTPESLHRQATRAAAGEFALSTVGIGADFNEALMASLADHGTGNFYYLEDTVSLAWVFNAEFDTARETVVSGLTVTIHPADGVTVIDAAGYPLERTSGGVVFRPGTLFVDQERRVWVTLRVPTRGLGDVELGSFTLAYSTNGEHEEIVLENLPRIACAERQDDFISAVEKDDWARGVAVEDFNSVQQQVAELVKKGDRDQAHRVLDEFEGRNAGLNLKLRSEVVAVTLEKVRELKGDVADAFVGSNQQEKQNKLSKDLYSDSVENRRLGSRK